MSILIALLPALLWGCTPIWTHYMGGNPISQLLGTTYGAMIVGIVLYLFKRPVIDGATFWWCFLAGVAWSVGQLVSYISFDRLGVATTIPIAAGVQLVFVNISGVIWFNSWQATVAKIVGFIAVILVIVGVFLSTRGGDEDASPKSKAAFTRDLIILVLGATLGYGSCSVLPRIPNAEGWSTFPPQAVGMLVAAIVFSLIIKPFRESKPLWAKSTLKNIVTGFNSGLGTFFYLISIILNGVSTGFTLSQMTTVVSTFGGLVILHEHKNPKQLFYTLTGVGLIVLGGIMTGFIH